MARTGLASPTTSDDGHAEKKHLGSCSGDRHEDPGVAVTGSTLPAYGVSIRALRGFLSRTFALVERKLRPQGTQVRRLVLT
jgi:hypothetical protein